MPDWALSVSELNEYVRVKLAGDALLRAVSVRGEIMSFKRHVSGHLYFTLKDDQSRLQCAMFRSQAYTLDFMPADGQRVVATGSAGLYTAGGSFQLYVSAMRREGAGELFARFEKLKSRLAAEGLFDAAVKKPLPVMPRVIGVVTSRAGAALHDIIRVSRARNPRVEILLSPCLVQGAGAANEIAHAIRRLNEDGRAEVILVGRGGGSMEDLWAFNEELVARAIYESAIPVVSCVGHETDFTIADFVSDVRAATPSNAAELAVSDVSDMRATLMNMAARLTNALKASNRGKRLRLRAISASPVMRLPERMLTERKRLALMSLIDRLRTAFTRACDGRRERLGRALDTLSAINPERVMRRGFSCVWKDGHVVTDSALLSEDDQIAVRMRDGEVGARVCARAGKDEQ